MSLLSTLTYTNYLLLVILWAAILGLYMRHLRKQAKVGRTVKLLLIILTIDAFRTLFESIYFGVNRSADVGIFPYWLGEVLDKPHFIVIPKLVNLGAALLVLFVLLRRFLPTLFAEQMENEALITQQQREIAARQKIEKALMEEKRKAEEYLHVAGVMLIALDPNGRLTMANRMAREILGYEELELLNKEWFDLIPETERSIVRDMYRAMIERSEMSAPHYRNAVMTKSGERRIIEWHNIFVRDGVGRITGILSSGNDVTELVEMEQVNRALNLRNRQILSAAGEGIVGLEADGCIGFVNPAACKAFGRSEAALVNQPFSHLICEAPEDERAQPKASQRCALLETLADGRVMRAEDETFWRGDGASFPVEYVCAPIIEGGTLTGAVLVFRDIGRRKAIDMELRRSNQELQQFAYVASHDLQAPLRMISSYLKLLSRHDGGQLDENGREYLDHAVEGAGRMDGLIRDLLDYSRVSTQGQPMDAVSLNDVVDSALTTLRLAIQDRGAEVSADDLPVVCGDQGQLVRLFQNLIDNALKYTPEDRIPQVQISPARRTDKWIISVADNGIGIDEPHLESVFGIFRRLHAPGEFAGNGIGLAVCKRIVERHEGTIWVTSEPGRGSTFHFTLPVYHAVEAGK
ncbi:PAS domain S-box protein [Magnetospira sp. QH-2]|uniref:sensor histidine kinase n=1 Tax=Magnetospira sp. (strain QH-2) TaxID=1288970 RepID=UPI0003E81B63|nr:PAS domain-containing sensor histidine kinase [Magnetospira sp. QH-2]CCQ73447.1 Putative histidine kinase with PAS domain [Magnetospira sp. QH-2]